MAYTSIEFFCNLLLLCNNAIIFSPEDSPESIAAIHLQHLVNKKMTATIKKLAQPPPTMVESVLSPLSPFSEPKQIVFKLKEDPDLADSLLAKPSSSTPIITY